MIVVVVAVVVILGFALPVFLTLTVEVEDVDDVAVVEVTVEVEDVDDVAVVEVTCRATFNETLAISLPNILQWLMIISAVCDLRSSSQMYQTDVAPASRSTSGEKPSISRV